MIHNSDHGYVKQEVRHEKDAHDQSTMSYGTLMTAGLPYSIEYHDLSKLPLLSQDRQVFAIIKHGTQSHIDTRQPLLINLALPPLGNEKLDV